MIDTDDVNIILNIIMMVMMIIIAVIMMIMMMMTAAVMMIVHFPVLFRHCLANFTRCTKNMATVGEEILKQIKILTAP